MVLVPSRERARNLIVLGSLRVRCCYGEVNSKPMFCVAASRRHLATTHLPTPIPCARYATKHHGSTRNELGGTFPRGTVVVVTERMVVNNCSDGAEMMVVEVLQSKGPSKLAEVPRSPPGRGLAPVL